MLTEEETLQLEMDYTSLHDSCLAEHPDDPDRRCRRTRGHERTWHASGHPLKVWT